MLHYGVVAAVPPLLSIIQFKLAHNELCCSKYMAALALAEKRRVVGCCSLLSLVIRTLVMFQKSPLDLP